MFPRPWALDVIHALKKLERLQQAVYRARSDVLEARIAAYYSSVTSLALIAQANALLARRG